MKKETIAIYGLSAETEKELPDLLQQYYVIGLLDSFKTNGSIYGQPIISIEEAIAYNVNRIIVIARPGSCKAIARKIGATCKEHDICLFDIRGNDLLAERKVRFNFSDSNIRVYSYADAVNEIKKVDAVSFDLFDTLITRLCMSSDDVLMLALGDRKKVEKRIAAEKELSQNYAPRLEVIYRYAFPEADVEEIKECVRKEFETDCKLIFPREDMIAICKEASRLGKKVYITTDSYYSLQQIEEILENLSIFEYTDLLISCEEGVGKQQGLFLRLKNLAGTNKIIHFGDDEISDIKNAELAGILSQKIYSPMELYDALGELGLSKYIFTISDRIKVGMLVAALFNNPFRFEETSRVIIGGKEELGYSLFAPLLTDFINWFSKETVEYDNVLFSARDGYLLNKIFKLVDSRENSQYFLISRNAVVRSLIDSIKDVEEIKKMHYSGTEEAAIKVRFGINSDNMTVDKVVKHILKNAEEKRKNYIRYIEGLDLKGENIALFDFVARGMNQKYVSRIIDKKITGLYFLQLEPEYAIKNDIAIRSFYAEEERESSVIFNDYYILEIFLTAPTSSLDEFDSEGKAVYAEETRSEKDIRTIMSVQQGIIDYVKRYFSIIDINNVSINKSLDEAILSLIHQVEIRDKDVLDLVVEDPFFGRNTRIQDLI